MEVPKVLDSSKLKTSFQQQPPRLVRWGFHPSPYKPLMIGIADDEVVCRVEFTLGRKADVILKEWKAAWPDTIFVHDVAATGKIAAKIFGKKGPLTVYMTGTKFQQAVWKTILQLPRGETMTYAEVATRIKKPKAVRAVGTACGANPVPLLIPCHRIVGSNGGLGGFGGGLDMKLALLRHEGALDLAS